MAKIAKPLTRLLKAEVPFLWSKDVQFAFESLRDIICSEPLLKFPNFQQQFLVTTDASNYAVGAVLSQGQIGKDLPIAYASRTLNNAESNYSTIEKELLAVLFAIEHFRPYLYGQKFILVTDHRPLIWLHNVKDPTSRLMRWRIRLNDYDYEMVYKPGKINSNADALSRNPPVLVESQNILPFPTKCLTTHTETESTDASPPKRLQGVVVGADDLPIATSKEVGDIDVDGSTGDKNERLVAGIFLVNRDCSSGYNEINNKTNHSDSDSIDSDEYYTADEDESVPSNKSIPKGGESPKECNVNVMRGGSLRGGTEDMPLFGSLSDIGKADFEGTPPQAPVDGVPVSQGICALPEIGNKEPLIRVEAEAQQSVLFPNSYRGTGSATSSISRMRLWRGLGEPAASGMTESGKKWTRSSVENVFENDSYTHDKFKIFLTNLVPSVQASHPCPFPNIIYYKDHLYMRKDNLLHFFSTDFQVSSQVSKDLLTQRKFSIDQIQAYNVHGGTQHIFHLFSKVSSVEQQNFRHLASSLSSLKNLMESLNVKSISLSKSDNNIEPIKWNCFEYLLKQTFNNSQFNITVCTGEIIFPSLSKRPLIIQEYHESIAGGHQGVTKLFKRIRENFYWTQMGKDISTFVRSCSNCQRNKILSAKTKQPMRITDTPQRALEKVQMDIVGPFTCD